MSLSYAHFATRFPPLVAPTPSAAEQTWIETTLSRLSLTTSYEFFGASLSEAILLQAAHEWVGYKRSEAGGAQGGGAGAIESESVGDWSLSWAVIKSPDVSAADAYWGGTMFGMQYLALRNSQLGMLSRVSR